MLKNERRTIMNTLLSERKAVLQSIDEQRVATLNEIESVGSRIAGNVLKQVKPLIYFVFIRIVQVLAILLVCGMLGAIIIVRLMSKRKTAVSME